MKKIVVGYIRVSTDKQNKRGFTIGEQEKMVTRYYEKYYGKTYNFVLINDGGLSARTMKRKGMKQLLELVENKNVHAVIFSSTDRLSRNTIDTLVLVRTFISKKIVVHSLYDDTKYETASDILNLTIKAAINEFESARTGERSKVGLDGKAYNGFYPYGNLPLGISKCKKTNTLYHNKDIIIVKTLYNLYKQKNLTLQEISTQIKKMFPDFKLNLTRGYLTRMFKITLYQGYYNRIMSDGSLKKFYVIDPIFTDEDLENIDKINYRLKRKNIHKYELLGKVYLIDNTRLMHCKQRKKLKDGSINEYNYYYSRKHSIWINEDVLLFTLRKAIHKNKSAAKKLVDEKINELDELFVSGIIDKEKYTTMFKKIKKQENIGLMYKKIIVDFDKNIEVVF